MSRGSKKKAAVARSNASVSSAGERPGGADSHPLKSGNGQAGRNGRWFVSGVCLFLAAIVWLVFGQTLHHEFVNYDDNLYVYDNPEVARGLTLQGIVWAFTHAHASNWHPLTWLSHMLDCQWYGLNPGGHHFTNVLLHTATVILLFLVLRRMTGFLWRSAFVAAVFAIHPLRVESVAWVAERKDVLSGLFFMLTLWAYGRYVEKSKVQSPRSKVFFGLTLVFFALGLMSKPMLVTLPLVLLLLDYWPLGRFTIHATTPPLRLLLEKLPLFGLAAASCVATIYAQMGAILPFEKLSLRLRVGNALISSVAYLGQLFWPSGLTVFYPFTPKAVGVSSVALSLVVLAGITGGVFILRRRCPCYLTGWLWYLIMLVPVIGLVQVGEQARADRYTYLPQIGLYLMLTWAAAELCVGWRPGRVVLGGAATAVLAGLICCARAQTAYWRDSESLWTHALACTSDTFFGHTNLGNALFNKGRVDEAIAQFQQALQLKPGYADAHINLGNALLKKGRVDEAIAQFQQAVQLKPGYAQAHNNLGDALLKAGRLDEAITQFQMALQLEPDYAEAGFNLGNALSKQGRLAEAMAHYQQALHINPGYAKAHINFGNTLIKMGRPAEAIIHFQKALQLAPGSAEAQNNLAWVLATSSNARLRDGPQAVRWAERACELTHNGVAPFLSTLAAAYAEAGRFDEAVATGQKACALAAAAGEAGLLENNQKLLALYRAHQPYHESAEKAAPAAP